MGKRKQRPREHTRSSLEELNAQAGESKRLQAVTGLSWERPECSVCVLMCVWHADFICEGGGGWGWGGRGTLVGCFFFFLLIWVKVFSMRSRMFLVIDKQKGGGGGEFYFFRRSSSRFLDLRKWCSLWRIALFVCGCSKDFMNTSSSLLEDIFGTLFWSFLTFSFKLKGHKWYVWF